MKAFLLAGGHGERLRPFTNRLPKCLVPIGGVPLLRIWLDLCVRSGINSVLINVSHHLGPLQEFLQAEDLGLDVQVVHEQQPIGNAGTVRANREFVSGEDNFFVLYSDNLTDASLPSLLAFHEGHAGVVTLALFRTPSPRSSGIVDVGADGRIRSFQEKPEHPASDLANAGIYVCRQEVFDHIPAGGPVVDFGRDVFPGLIGRLYGTLVEGYLQDIGTPEGLATARREWKSALSLPGPRAALAGESS